MLWPRLKSVVCNDAKKLKRTRLGIVVGVFELCV